MKLFLLLMLSAAIVKAKDLPKIEAGIGVGSQFLADYRGTTSYQAQAIPFPYLIYRGDFLKADRRGLRGEFFRNHKVELNLSADAALNGDSEDNDLREGMPELDSAFELGPSLNINLTGAGFENGWALRLPLRAVFTISDDGIDDIGYVANPRLTYRKENFIDHWDISLNLGLLYGSNRYHEYYYSVQPEFATITRPTYNADAGYSGTFARWGMRKRVGSVWYGFSLRYDNLSGAVFDDSPLVETDHYFSVGLGIAWVFWESPELVNR